MQHRTVFEVMTSPAVTAQPNWNLVETARTMHRKGVRRLPVTDENGVVRLTGRVDERADIPVIVRLCRSVDGVVALHESIEYAYDNLALDVEPPR
ncbi:CBS domain-containing protein [Streptomyces sp. CB02130]|uniref:CBS domain-containing protein n=1 Tax=Streptomyces sp. CB02130 TaxID=1703934 RepID=UPI00093FBB75|nr:CBS domain-containing protein [Streptomyces sp. CB02130]